MNLLFLNTFSLNELDFSWFSFLFIPFEINLDSLNGIENSLDVAPLIHNSFFVGRSLPASAPFYIKIVDYLIFLFLNMTVVLWMLIRLFRFLCYSRLVMEWFPMINPYRWPQSLFYRLTLWYTQLWFLMLPPLFLPEMKIWNIKLPKAINISYICSLVFLETLGTYLFMGINCLTNVLVGFQNAYQ